MPLLLNKTSPIEFGLWIFSIPALGLYVGFLALLVNHKSFGWRLIGFLVAVAVALFGLFLYKYLTWWSSILMFSPLLTGMYGVYFMPRKASVKQ
ncbi:hypothetical protein [Hymenobacter negativus]|uniref:DUF2651 domain-containing protein n=1 Tax=Hymenobacter negativus TaxID=2795026 RepID=A0ABS3QNW4_9BACT|nr:hypothetical protein [Hymenobacter negativus]MBO2012975.1 hypothetical protein [Hymenobacter negativus]